MKKIVLKKKHKKLIPAGLVLLIILLAAGYRVIIVPRLNTQEWVYKEQEVKRGDFIVGITENGTLEYTVSEESYDLDLDGLAEEDGEDEEEEQEEIADYLEVESISASVGQKINQGDLILSFTKKSVDGVRNLIEKKVSEDQISLVEAKSEYNLAIIETEAEYQRRLIEAKGAESKLDGSLSQTAWDIREMELQILSLYEEIVSLNSRWETVEATRESTCLSYNQLHEQMKGITDNVEYAKLHEKYLNAKQSYENALENQGQIKESIIHAYEQIEEYENKITKAREQAEIGQMEGRHEYESSITEGELALEIRENEMEKLLNDMEKSQNQLEESEQLLKSFEAFVGDGNIYAKEAGIITEIGYEEGEELIQKGTIFSYTAPENMKISVDVSQEDIVTLEVGDQVEIIFSAYQDQTYQGVISAITTTSTSEYASTISYQVMIDVMGDTGKLYGGMTADVTFVTEKKQDVVYISKTALEKENGKNFVYMKDKNGEIITRDVETGMENTIYVEITEGLEEGEIIYAASKVNKQKEKSGKASEKEKESMTEGTGDSMGGFMEGNRPPMGEFEFPQGMDFEPPAGMNGMQPPSGFGRGGGFNGN